MPKKRVAKGQAVVRFKLEAAETYLDLQNATISEDVAYRIYKMILDDQGKTRAPDLDAIFGAKRIENAVPQYPASVTRPA